jgi:hypothetical protein
MRSVSIIILLLTITTSIAYSQTTEATTTEGKKVILKQDGTWEFKDDSKSSVKKTFKSDCIYRTNEVDEFTGTKKLVLEADNFVNYTDEELKRFFKNKDYIACKAYTAKVNDLKVLYTFWTIQTKTAFDTYGYITKGSQIIIKFVDGQTLDLKFASSDTGDSNYDRDYTTYSSYLLLDESAVELLQSSEVEKIRMYWSKGYEEYPVSNPRLFINQLPCLE